MLHLKLLETEFMDLQQCDCEKKMTHIAIKIHIVWTSRGFNINQLFFEAHKSNDDVFYFCSGLNVPIRNIEIFC